MRSYNNLDWLTPMTLSANPVEDPKKLAADNFEKFKKIRDDAKNATTIARINADLKALTFYQNTLFKFEGSPSEAETIAREINHDLLKIFADPAGLRNQFRQIFGFHHANIVYRIVKEYLESDLSFTQLGMYPQVKTFLGLNNFIFGGNYSSATRNNPVQNEENVNSLEKFSQVHETIIEDFQIDLSINKRSLEGILNILERIYFKGYINKDKTWEPNSLLPYIVSRMVSEWNKDSTELLDICKHPNFREQIILCFVQEFSILEELVKPSKSILKAFVGFMNWFHRQSRLNVRINSLLEILANLIFARKIFFKDLDSALLNQLEPLLAKKHIDNFNCQKALEFIYGLYKMPFHQFQGHRISEVGELVDKILLHLLDENEELTGKRIADFIFWYAEHMISKKNYMWESACKEYNNTWSAYATHLLLKLISKIKAGKYTVSYPNNDMFKLVECNLAEEHLTYFNLERALLFLYNHYTHPLYNWTVYPQVSELLRKVVTAMLKKHNGNAILMLEALVKLYPNASLPGCVRLHQDVIHLITRDKTLSPLPIHLIWPNVPKDDSSLFEYSAGAKTIIFKGETYKFEKEIGKGDQATIAKYITADGKKSICVKTYLKHNGINVAWAAANASQICRKKYGIGAFGADPANPEQFIVIMSFLEGETLREIYQKIFEKSKRENLKPDDSELLELFLLSVKELNQFHKEEKLVHGDPKDLNIIFNVDAKTGEKKATLIDFDLTRKLGEPTTQFPDDPKNYSMAPELGKGIAADFSQDVARIVLFIYPIGYSNPYIDKLINLIKLSVCQKNPKLRPSLDLIIKIVEEAISILKNPQDRLANRKLSSLIGLIRPLPQDQTPDLSNTRLSKKDIKQRYGFAEYPILFNTRQPRAKSTDLVGKPVLKRAVTF